MTHTERLNKMSVRALKQEIVKHNSLTRGYSRLRKADIIKLIIKNKHLFKHLFPSTTSSKSTNTQSTSTSTTSTNTSNPKPPPPPPSQAKKKLAKVMSAKNKPMKEKKDRVRIYRFRVNGKEFKRSDNVWSRMIEVKGGFPVRQKGHLWTAAANTMWNKLKKSGKLTFKHNISAPEVRQTPASPPAGLFMM